MDDHNESKITKMLSDLIVEIEERHANGYKVSSMALTCVMVNEEAETLEVLEKVMGLPHNNVGALKILEQKLLASMLTKTTRRPPPQRPEIPEGL